MDAGGVGSSWPYPSLLSSSSSFFTTTDAEAGRGFGEATGSILLRAPSLPLRAECSLSSFLPC